MNWGGKLILTMLIFMAFILAMGAYMLSKQGNDALVESNYYEKGLNYDDEYQSKKNTVDDGLTPIIKVNESQIVIQMKDCCNYELRLIRPSDAKSDKKMKGKTIGENHLILIPRTAQDKGLWFLDLEWKINNKNYRFKQNITL
ncbi:FixH family protein [Pedobacter aquatilis]|uniref:FixH family protein n=1 Tax=Pedobacter aquatilis TaxID=351343 RepID=UPI002930D30A|nr:FixH family protein [Pedobacter aquatilis]